MPDSAPPWSALRATLAGDIVEAPTPTTFNARFHDRRPLAVVRCTSPEDVAATLAFVQDHDLPWVPRSGGHCFAGQSSTRGVVLDISPLDRVVPDGDGDRVTVGAGARLGPLNDRLQQDGRTLPSGTCPTVGVAGLVLAGGLGILGRKHGLTSDQMLAADVVLADGRVVTCDEDHEPDLFWALRGAGAGNLGVVTSFVFRTLPAPPATNVHLAWPAAQAAAAIAEWQRWLPTAPDELSAASLKLRTSTDPAAPAMLDFYGVFLGSPGDADDVLAPYVRAIGAAPTWSRQQHLPFAETRRFWAALPPAGAEPEPEAEAEPNAAAGPWFVAKSEFFRQPLPDDVIAAVVEELLADRQPGEERELDFMPWGGAYNRPAPDATAFVHRSEQFQLKHSATLDPAAPAATKAAALAYVRSSWDRVHPWGAGGVFPAFPDPDLPDPAAAYYGTNRPRLEEVKARYDPHGFFGTLSGHGEDP